MVVVVVLVVLVVLAVVLVVVVLVSGGGWVCRESQMLSAAGRAEPLHDSAGK